MDKVYELSEKTHVGDYTSYQLEQFLTGPEIKSESDNRARQPTED